MDTDKKNTSITVTIDTKNININNLDSTVKFSDDRGGSEGLGLAAGPKDFTSLVDKDKYVTWQAEVDPDSHDPGDSVKLLSVFMNPYNPGGNLLKADAYIAKNDGTITGTVKRDPPKKINEQTNEETYEDENYYIVFMVNKENGTSPKNIYSIDPKLRIQSG